MSRPSGALNGARPPVTLRPNGRCAARELGPGRGRPMVGRCWWFVTRCLCDLRRCSGSVPTSRTAHCGPQSLKPAEGLIYCIPRARARPATYSTPRSTSYFRQILSNPLLVRALDVPRRSSCCRWTLLLVRVLDVASLGVVHAGGLRRRREKRDLPSSALHEGEMEPKKARRRRRSPPEPPPAAAAPRRRRATPAAEV